MKSTHVYTKEFNSDVLIRNLIECVMRLSYRDSIQDFKARHGSFPNSCQLKPPNGLHVYLSSPNDIELWGINGATVYADASKEAITVLLFDIMLEGMIHPYMNMQYNLIITTDEMNYDIKVFAGAYIDEQLVAHRSFKLEVEGDN